MKRKTCSVCKGKSLTVVRVYCAILCDECYAKWVIWKGEAFENFINFFKENSPLEYLARLKGERERRQQTKEENEQSPSNP